MVLLSLPILYCTYFIHPHDYSLTWNRQDAKHLLSDTRKHRRNPQVPDANEPEVGEQIYKYMQMLKSFLLCLRWREFTWIF